MAGGHLAYEGPVEVFYKGIWGTVCDNYWDLHDATVVCHQLEFPAAIAAKTSATFWKGAGKIWMDRVMCTGNESSLLDCDHSGWGINKCSHDEDAGVICSTGGKEHLQL